MTTRGYAVAVLNPLRTRRFAEEELERTKTDAIDALGIARFAAQKRPAPAQLPDPAAEELRELVRLRERLLGDLGDRLRQLHRAVDLGLSRVHSPCPYVRKRTGYGDSFALSNCGRDQEALLEETEQALL